MKASNRILSGLIGTGALLVSGCMYNHQMDHPMPVLDSHFGESVNTAKALQTLNPQASSNTDPVAGIDGKAANETMDRYVDSFKTPPPTTTVINIGGGIGGGNQGGGR